jgi:predicted nucleotidyltransferase
MKEQIDIPYAQIAAICKNYGIRKLSVFGSALRSDFGRGSDVDVLVEFEPDRLPGLAFFTIERELAEALQRKVDLNTPDFLSKYFRDEVLAEAEAIYVAP